MSHSSDYSSDEQSRRGSDQSEEAYQQYEQSMIAHTKKLLTKAERIAYLRDQIAKQPHNSQIGKIIPSVARAPNVRARSMFKGILERTQKEEQEESPPMTVEETIATLSQLSVKPTGISKTAAIKTPVHPMAASKKKVLNKLGLRLTLDDRRPTVG